MQFSAEAAPTEVVGRVPPPTRSLGAPRRSRFLRPPWIWLVVAVIVWVGIGVVASRPKNTTVPKIAGMQLAAAERAASDAGLRIDPAVDVTYTTNARPKGTVLLVTPSPGATVRRGTHLHLTVSNGPPPCCTVPLVTGKTLPDATAALEAAQLQIGLVSYRAPTEHEQSGIVVDQTPNAGVTLKPGDQVDIVVTSQPAPAGHKKKDHEG
jgi:serine/threonine-protein kinase